MSHKTEQEKNALAKLTGEKIRGKYILLVVSCAFLLALAWTAANTTSAYAKSYTMPKVDIVAEVTSDGSLNVTEQRTFDFTGSFSAVWWAFEGLPENAQLKLNGASLTSVDAQGNPQGEPRILPETGFALSWREAGGPSEDAVSLDYAQDTIYVFFQAADERLLVSLEYTVENGAQLYKDTGELYWQYVTAQWAEDSSNVSMNLTLPVPEGDSVIAGETVRAWGHGPLDGSVVFNDNGTITYKVPRVNSGQYAEARVIFPVSWLKDVSEEDSALTRTQPRFEKVLREEEAWADQANRERIGALVLIIGSALIAIGLLLWAIRMYTKHGKEYTPTFTEQYWRDVPSEQDHPAVIGRLWRWDRESPDDLTATLMHLSHIGAVQINKGSYEKPGAFGAKLIDDYYFTKVPAVADSLTDPIDIAAMDLLFKEIAKGEDALWFGSIEKFGKDKPEKFIKMMEVWQGKVSSETNKRDFFELKGRRLQTRMIIVAGVFLAAAIAAWVMLENFFPLIFAVPSSIVLFIIAGYMPRRSREGNDLDAKCKALKNWLKDFSALDERPPTDVKVWGEFMVYAHLFGVAKQVMKDLQITVPELFEEDGLAMSNNYVPWWFWYSASHGMHGSVMAPASDLFQTSISNTMKSAQAAVSAASGGDGGGFSSGGGFGGGFSGGGGGGFGGGGGAR